MAVALWLVLAMLLWRTRVPGDLRAPHLDPRAIFTAAELRRADRHVRFLRVDLALSTLAQLAVIVILVYRRPRLRPLPLAAFTLAAAWLAALPFAVAAHWWERRYGIAFDSYGAWLVGRLPGLALAVGGGTAAVGALLFAGARWRLAAWPLLCALGLGYVLLSPLASGGHARGRVDGVRVVVQDVHRDTRLANAEAVGVGFTQRIVLWDTLLRFPRADVRLVEAHELAHIRRQHVWKGLAWFVLLSLPATIVLARVADPSDPPRLVHVVLGDHPTLLERIELAEAWRARRR